MVDEGLRIEKCRRVGIHSDVLGEGVNCNVDMLVEFHVALPSANSSLRGGRLGSLLRPQSWVYVEAKWQAGCFEGTWKHLRRTSVSCTVKGTEVEGIHFKAPLPSTFIASNSLEIRD